MARERKQGLLLLGPVIAAACITLAIGATPGSGVFMFAVVAAIGFMAIPPVVQVGLLATERFGDCHVLACAAGVGLTFALLLLPLALGVFSLQ